MKLPRILLRTGWIAAALAVIVAWCFMAALTGLTFLFAYGSPPGAYTGQIDDRQAAWVFLVVLAVLSVIVLAAAWPIARWYGRLQPSARATPTGQETPVPPGPQ